MKAFLAVLLCLFCQPLSARNAQSVDIAFLPDVHFHDIYANFNSVAFQGIKLAGLNKPVIIRSMAAQLHSTRLFNENYFALISALDDIASRGIKFVALPGDFTDDGQPAHLQGLKTLLKEYEKKHGMRFFAIPGNHDPVSPFGKAGGKSDFLTATGTEIGVFSLDHKNCQPTMRRKTTPTICSEAIKHAGYADTMAQLPSFGLTPDPRDVLWETPFSKDRSKSSLTFRHYKQCSSDKKTCVSMPDTSYLVEPTPGLWLLAIDANVYMPSLVSSEVHFQGSGNAGYNKILTEKPFLLTWIKEIVARAKVENKTLIAFSHFPMAEFYEQQSPAIRDVFGHEAFQLAREPLSSTSDVLAKTGLRLHIAGHMHMNDTSVTRTPENVLVNVQAPSIAAYRPAYKLVSVHNDVAQINTIKLDEVTHFNALFPAYLVEHQYLTATHSKAVWDDNILHARNYHEFAKAHLLALARMRFFPTEWSKVFKSELLDTSLFNLLQKLPTHTDTLPSKDLQLLKSTTLMDFVGDFYMLRNAGSLALLDIPQSHQLAYIELANQLRNRNRLANQEVDAACSNLNKKDATWCLVGHALAQALSIFQQLNQDKYDECVVVKFDARNAANAVEQCDVASARNQ